LAVYNIQESNALLLYRVGPVLVCSPTLPVEAVVMPPKITVPPGANVAEPGVFKSMFGMVRLVDLRVRFGVDEEDFTDPGRVVIVEVEGGHAGFWVDEIEDVISFPDSGWKPVPVYIPRNVFSRTLVQKESIRLFADFDLLDKFKTSGYLRKHIESLKAAKIKLADEHKKSLEAPDKINIGASKYTVSESINNAVKLKVENESPAVSRTIKNDDLAYKKMPSKPVPHPREDETKKEAANRDSQTRPVVERRETGSNEPIQDAFHDLKNDRKMTGLSRAGKASVEGERSIYGINSAKEDKSLINNKASKDSMEKAKASGFLWLISLGVILVALIYILIYSIGFNDDNLKKIKSDFPRKEIVTGLDETGRQYAQLEEYPISEKEKRQELAETGGQTGLLAEIENDSQVEAQTELQTVSTTTTDTQVRAEPEAGVLREIEGEFKKERAVKIVKKGSDVLIEINDFVEAEEKIPNEAGNNIGSIQDAAENIVPVKEQESDASNSEGSRVNEKMSMEKERINQTDDKLPEKIMDIKVSGYSNRIPGDEDKKFLKEESVKSQSKSKVYINNTTKVSRKKYTHVVVKGDTLWHIAKQYVDNPWRYPELARLSNIKNPDLIYPGDHVTIIINFRRNN